MKLVNKVGDGRCVVTCMRDEPGFIVKFYDKAYEKMDLLELVNAPVDAISGVSKSDAEKLKKAFNIETVADFATNKYVKLAQAVTNFAECSGQILDKEFQSKDFAELVDKPVHAINGVSKEDAKLLREAFNIKTVRDLAKNKYVAIAQATVSLAGFVELLHEMNKI
jgi:hypothetical protein